jgi:mitogen-activated protein kinase kinase kinase
MSVPIVGAPVGAVNEMEAPPPPGPPPSCLNDSSAMTGSTIPPDLAAAWPLQTVLSWLARNKFSREWQDTFKGLELYGAKFLDLGGRCGGRGDFGKMHQDIYPRLATECTNNGTGWNQGRERREAKRIRELIRSIILEKASQPKGYNTGRSSIFHAVDSVN